MLNSETIRKIWKKGKLNSEKIGKIGNKSKLNGEMIGKIWNKSKLISDKIWKIIHHKPNPLFTKTYTYLPIYLHFHQNYRFYSIFCYLFSYLNEFQMSTIKFILPDSLTQCSIDRVVRKLTS
jgi:hypothetical protein